MRDLYARGLARITVFGITGWPSSGGGDLAAFIADRQADGEACTAADSRPDGQVSPMLFCNDGMDDREALSGSLTRFLGREEGFEDFLQVFLGNAAAGIGNLDLGRLTVASRRDGDDALFAFS